MGTMTSLLAIDFTPTADCCERVAMAMGEGVVIDERLMLWVEYDSCDEVVEPFIVVCNVEGVRLGRFNLNHAINLTAFGEPFVVFPRALMWGDGGKPAKLMIDCWTAKPADEGPFVTHFNEMSG